MTITKVKQTVLVVEEMESSFRIRLNDVVDMLQSNGWYVEIQFSTIARGTRNVPEYCALVIAKEDVEK